MAATSFDPTRAVRFDLPQGRVHTSGAAGGGERVMLVPTSAIDDIALSAPPEAVEALGRALGASIGRRAAARLAAAGAGEAEQRDAAAVANASIEGFVTQLAGEFAISGAGVLSIERWGRALVVVIEGSPLNGTLLSPLVAAAIEASSGRAVGCTLLSRDEHMARLLIASVAGIARVRDWMASGVAWADALSRLQGRGS